MSAMRTIPAIIGAAILVGIILLQPATLTAIEGADEYVAHQNRAADFGSLVVHGPMTIDGDLAVGGDLTVHGPLTVNRIEYAQIGRMFAWSAAGAKEIDGPLTLRGVIAVAGDLRVDGPLTVSGRLIRATPNGGDTR